MIIVIPVINYDITMWQLLRFELLSTKTGPYQACLRPPYFIPFPSCPRLRLQRSRPPAHASESLVHCLSPSSVDPPSPSSNSRVIYSIPQTPLKSSNRYVATTKSQEHAGSSSRSTKKDPSMREGGSDYVPERDHRTESETSILVCSKLCRLFKKTDVRFYSRAAKGSQGHIPYIKDRTIVRWV